MKEKTGKNEQKTTAEVKKEKFEKIEEARKIEKQKVEKSRALAHAEKDK